MGSCDHDTCVALIVTSRKAQCRDRHKGVIDADIDPVACKNGSGFFRKNIALKTAVIADCYGLIAALCLDPVRNALRSLANDPDIHAVGTCAECPAETGGSECERDRETVLDRFVIISDLKELRFEIRVFEISGKPAFVLILIHCTYLHSGRRYGRSRSPICIVLFAVSVL